jgi:hypothetical protein
MRVGTWKYDPRHGAPKTAESLKAPRLELPAFWRLKGIVRPVAMLLGKMELLNES